MSHTNIEAHQTYKVRHKNSVNSIAIVDGYGIEIYKNVLDTLTCYDTSWTYQTF